MVKDRPLENAASVPVDEPERVANVGSTVDDRSLFPRRQGAFSGEPASLNLPPDPGGSLDRPLCQKVFCHSRIEPSRHTSMPRHPSPRASSGPSHAPLMAEHALATIRRATENS
jgi:hypothetical protein